MKGYYFKPYCKCNNKCRCDATWYFKLSHGINPQTGQPHQVKKGGFKTKKAAKEKAREIVDDIDNGTYISETPVTFEEFAYEWLGIYQNTGNVKESTIRVRNHEIKRLLDYLAQIRLTKVTRNIYQNALNELKKRGFAHNTLDGVHRTGRMIFKKAIELELIKKDPTEFAYIPKDVATVEDIENNSDLPNYLELDELKLFLNTAKEKGLDQDYTIFLLLSHSGMRVGELCALKWSDIDFQSSTINITKTYYNPRNNAKQYKILTPKTKSSVRKIAVDNNVLKELKSHLHFQNKVKLRKGANYNEEGFVFTLIDNHAGYPWNPKKVGNRMRRILKLSSLPESFTPHSLRHTHTSLLAQAEVELSIIMERLGHIDEKTTRNVYLHVTKDMKIEAIQKFQKLMDDL
ncbi:site-specific integrase [Bacillus shivajii]|uniref:tyrosine-type recombinase/integrase n=1 Tax=Bacillus shivajii TaxID=1983719 RepID=UPI001CFBDB35|nr:site-specific integrase [Bacillus shivajii]UCZ53714.1 site-specific integrase [Bacillus shivajii]